MNTGKWLTGAGRSHEKAKSKKKEKEGSSIWKSFKNFDFHMPVREDLPHILLGLGIILVLSWLFYRNVMAAILLFPFIIPFHEKMRRERILRENHEIGRQFRDALISVSTSQKAGYSIENSFVSAYGDMTRLYGEQSPICRELRRIEKGLRNNIVIEKLLADMGERTMNKHIEEFASVFAVAKKSGGNMTAMLEATVSQIGNRTEVEREIDIITSAGKMEARIMEVIPMAILFYVSISNPGFFDPLYHNLFGIAVMTACLGVYITGYVWIEKIIQLYI